MNVLASVPKHVKIVEVGPRDGLQNVAETVPTADKIRFIDLLTESGLSRIEATSFVSPKWVPQLADAEEVVRGIRRAEGVQYPVLAPNLRGLERAIDAGAREVAFFTAASEAFTQKNINSSILESLDVFGAMALLARQNGLWIRAYVSTAFHCPYVGPVASQQAIAVARSLFDAGAEEVSLGDTIGHATPREVADLTDQVLNVFDSMRIAFHFHDTRGTALANILVALQMGIRIFDSSAGGLGGCPFAPGASGNVATEDLLYLLHGMGVNTGVDIEKVVAASLFIGQRLGRPLPSRYLQSRWNSA